MTTAELITIIKLMLGENYSDELLSAYISQAQTECLNWEYSLIGIPPLEEEETERDYSKYDNLVIDAVIFAMSIRGAEGETQHSENGILRGYKYSDMRQYIHAHLIPYVKIL